MAPYIACDLNLNISNLFRSMPSREQIKTEEFKIEKGKNVLQELFSDEV